MPYTPSSKPPETAWARHLDQVRRDNGWSATELFRQVRHELKLGENSRSTFVADLHLDPKPHWKPGLIRLFGEPPEPASDAPQATETPDPAQALISAMTDAMLAQARALTDLRADLVEARDAAKSEREAMTKMLARLEARLAELQPPGGRGSAAADQASGHR